MKAEHFYNEVMNVNHNEEGYYGWYCNNMITIHKTGSGDKDIHYTLHRNGSIIGSDCRRYAISDLIGDYEPYSEVQILKCGYLLFNSSSFHEIKTIISTLHNEFGDEEFGDKKTEKRRLLCGGSIWTDGLTENFSYYAPNGIEVSLYSIPNICSKNLSRHKFGKKCLPFNKKYQKEKAIYVSFVSFITESDLNERVDEALKDLLKNLPECEWVNMKMLRYIYS